MGMNTTQLTLQGVARHGEAWSGAVWQYVARAQGFNPLCIMLYFKVWRGSAGRGRARLGEATHGKEAGSNPCLILYFRVRRGMAWLGRAWLGMARQGMEQRRAAKLYVYVERW